jgi:hypothetical protein
MPRLVSLTGGLVAMLLALCCALAASAQEERFDFSATSNCSRAVSVCLRVPDYRLSERSRLRHRHASLVRARGGAWRSQAAAFHRGWRRPADGVAVRSPGHRRLPRVPTDDAPDVPQSPTVGLLVVTTPPGADNTRGNDPGAVPPRHGARLFYQWSACVGMGFRRALCNRQTEVHDRPQSRRPGPLSRKPLVSRHHRSLSKMPLDPVRGNCYGRC